MTVSADVRVASNLDVKLLREMDISKIMVERVESY